MYVKKGKNVYFFLMGKNLEVSSLLLTLSRSETPTLSLKLSESEIFQSKQFKKHVAIKRKNN
jgi:hypothetical protein